MPNLIGRFVSRAGGLLLLTMLVVITTPAAARACSCAMVETAEVVAEAPIVFVGREVGRTNTGGTWPPVAVTFEVAEVYKGTIGSELTVWTGSGGGDCGVGPTTGLVGIAAFNDEGRVTINICGSLHEPAAIAAVLDPIGLTAEALPPEPAADCCGARAWWPWLVAGGGIALAGLIVLRARSAVSEGNGGRTRQRRVREGWSQGDPAADHPAEPESNDSAKW